MSEELVKLNDAERISHFALPLTLLLVTALFLGNFVRQLLLDEPIRGLGRTGLVTLLISLSAVFFTFRLQQRQLRFRMVPPPCQSRGLPARAASDRRTTPMDPSKIDQAVSWLDGVGIWTAS